MSVEPQAQSEAAIEIPRPQRVVLSRDPEALAFGGEPVPGPEPVASGPETDGT